MDYDVAAAVGAGLIGGTAMIVPLYMGRAMMPQQMRMDLFLLLGTMMTPRIDRVMAYMMGAMMHAGASILFAFAHVGVFVAADIETDLAAWGLLFGAVHYMLSGMAMGMMPMMHPLVRARELENPGPFALSMGPMTGMGFLMLHLLFGVVVGTLYEAFI
ncbi:MAG: hypothetical protein V3V06_05960 [Dehalococcoidia bacterium]